MGRLGVTGGGYGDGGDVDRLEGAGVGSPHCAFISSKRFSGQCHFVALASFHLHIPGLRLIPV